MPNSFIGMVRRNLLTLVTFVITLVVCVSFTTSAVLRGSNDEELRSVRSLSDSSDSCSYSTSVFVTLDFTAIMSYYESNQIDSDNYTSYSIYTLTNDRVFEGLIDSNKKEHCLVAGDYKFLVEPLEVQQSGDSSTEDIYAPVVIKIQRFTDSHKIFTSPITEPLILHLQYNVFPWDIGTQQWSYQASAMENSLLALPSQDVSEWSSTTSFPSSLLSSSSHYYFRTQFSLDLQPGYSGFEIRYRAISSSSIYVNGMKIYEYEAPDSLASLLNPTWKTVTGLISTLQSGVNTVVVHLAPFSEPTAEKTHSFDLSLRLLHSYVFNSLNAELSLAPSTLYPLFNGDLTDFWSAMIFQGLYNTFTLEYPTDSSFLANQLCLVSTPSGALPSKIDVLVVEDGVPREIQTLQLAPEEPQDSNPCWDLHNYQGYSRYQLRIYSHATSNTVRFSEILFQLVAPNVSLALAYAPLAVVVGQARQCVAPSLSPNMTLGFCSTESALPEGVELDPLTGSVCIEGSPETEVESDLDVVCRTVAGSASASLHVRRFYQPCSTDEGVSVEHGEAHIVGPCGAGFSGNRVQICNNGVLSEVSDEQCQLLPPSDLSYVYEPFYSVQSDISLTPSLTNSASPFAANDTFPAGVSLDGESGVIAGTASEPFDAFIEITASNAAGSATFVIHLVVRQRVCEAEDGWPSVEWGETAQKEGCEEGYDGFLTRQCIDGVFGEVSFSECHLQAPQNLTYESTGNSEILFVFDPVELVPSVTGVEISYSASELPAGLTFNSENGYVEGRLESEEAVEFTVTASNAAGDTTAVVSLQAVYRPCKALEYLEEGTKGETQEVSCEVWGMTGSRGFECQLVGEEVKWVQVKDGCVSAKMDLSAVIALLCIVIVVLVVILLFVGLSVRSKKRDKQFRVQTMDVAYTCFVCSHKHFHDSFIHSLLLYSSIHSLTASLFNVYSHHRLHVQL